MPPVRNVEDAGDREGRPYGRVVTPGAMVDGGAHGPRPTSGNKTPVQHRVGI